MSPDTIHQIMKWIHIACGFVGLVVFWIPVFAKKGSRPHIIAGRVFVICGAVVGVTAMIASVWAMLSPATFISQPDASAEELGFVQFLLAILGWLGLSVTLSLWFGVDVIRTRQQPDRFGRRLNRVLNLLALTASAGLLVLAAVQTMSFGWQSRQLIPIALALFGFSDVRRFTRTLDNPRPTPMAWWYQHMEFMLGCGIGFHTAFAVFGFSRLLGDGYTAWIAFAWLLPAGVGMPATSLWIRHYKRKFGELDRTDGPRAPRIDIPVATG